MKSLDELNRIREEALKKVNLRQNNAQYRILIGMATCGIAAGARPVMKTFLEAIDKDQLQVTIQQTGCIGMCIHEPIVEIIDRDGLKTTYLEVTPIKAQLIIESHLKQGKIIEAYTHVTK